MRRRPQSWLRGCREARLEDVEVARRCPTGAFAARLLLERKVRARINSAAAELPVALVLDRVVGRVAGHGTRSAVVLLFAVPTVPEVLPPLEEVLLDVELPVVPDYPSAAAGKVPGRSGGAVVVRVRLVRCDSRVCSGASLLLLAVREPLGVQRRSVPGRLAGVGQTQRS